MKPEKSLADKVNNNSRAGSTLTVMAIILLISLMAAGLLIGVIYRLKSSEKQVNPREDSVLTEEGYAKKWPSYGIISEGSLASGKGSTFSGNIYIREGETFTLGKHSESYIKRDLSKGIIYGGKGAAANIMGYSYVSRGIHCENINTMGSLDAMDYTATVKGNICANNLVVGAKSEIDGDVKACEIIVDGGKLSGEITANSIIVRNGGVISGKVKAETLKIESGWGLGEINGKILELGYGKDKRILKKGMYGEEKSYGQGYGAVKGGIFIKPELKVDYIYTPLPKPQDPMESLVKKMSDRALGFRIQEDSKEVSLGKGNIESYIYIENPESLQGKTIDKMGSKNLYVFIKGKIRFDMGSISAGSKGSIFLIGEKGTELRISGRLAEEAALKVYIYICQGGKLVLEEGSAVRGGIYVKDERNFEGNSGIILEGGNEIEASEGVEIAYPAE